MVVMLIFSISNRKSHNCRQGAKYRSNTQYNIPQFHVLFHNFLLNKQITNRSGYKNYSFSRNKACQNHQKTDEIVQYEIQHCMKRPADSQKVKGFKCIR
jgi:hypothetical protein